MEYGETIMKRSTKGALAAGAAAVLLAGGAGSLAYWTADDTLDGGSVTAGNMTLSDVACDATWKEGADTITLIVPGDTITKNCTGTLVLTGEHIGATVALDATSVATAEAAFNGEVDITASMTAPAASITTPGSYPVTVVLSADFDETINNDEALMNATTTLNALVLTATQTHDTTP